MICPHAHDCKNRYMDFCIHSKPHLSDPDCRKNLCLPSHNDSACVPYKPKPIVVLPEELFDI